MTKREERLNTVVEAMIKNKHFLMELFRKEGNDEMVSHFRGQLRALYTVHNMIVNEGILEEQELNYKTKKTH